MYKFYNDRGPNLVTVFFQVKFLGLPPAWSVDHGTESIAFLGPKLWDMLWQDDKKLLSWMEFKQEYISQEYI